MSQFLKKIIGMCGVGVLFFILLPSHLWAAESFSELGVKNLSPTGEYCDNQDTCLGMCHCTVELDVGGLFGGKEYSWNVYNKHDHEKLFRVAGKKGGLDTAWYYEGFFNFSEKECKVTFEGDQEEVRNSAKADCKYYEPFCCCKQNGKELTDCQRAVYYDADKNFVATCGNLPKEYKPAKVGRGKTCADLEVASKPKDDKGSVSTIDARVEAKILNKVSFSNLTGFIGQIIRVLLAFIGSISLALYVYAGILWMTAAGSSDRIEKAKEIIVWTTLGVVIMLGSYLVVNYLFGFFK